MATPTIPNGETQFFPVVYSGNGQGQRVGKFVPFTDNGTIDNSCLFEKGDSPRLNRTPSGTGTSRRKYTLSVWAKPSLSSSASDERYVIVAGPYGNSDGITFDDDRTLKFWINGRIDGDFKTNRTFEDSSKFYHILVSVDTTQSTASDRVKIYVDGDQITSFSLETYPSQNYDGNWGSTASTNIGSSNSPNRYYNGYLAEINYVDGTALGPETFGVTDTSTGRWIPKTLSGITYGTNGFRLEFGDSSALGDDTSGNTNDFTATNLTASDQRTNTPTNNLPTMRPYNPSYSQVLSEGNLTTNTNGNNKGYAMCSTLRPKGSGKFYAEVRTSSNGGGSTLVFGCYTQEDLAAVTASGNVYIGHTGSNGCGSALWYVHGGTNQLKNNNVTTSNPSATINGGDVIGIALDLDNDLISFYDNSGSLIGSTTFDSSKSACFSAMSNTSVTFIWNYGDNGTFNGNETAGGNTDGDGNGNFYHSVPTGFKMLRQDNMPETARGVSGLVWTKNRDATDNHQVYDSSRGKQKAIFPNTTDVQATVTDGLQKFLAGGQQIEDSDAINTAGESFVSWNWVANGGTTASNTDGSITSTVQANTTAGFSIVRYTGTGSAGTVGHGLSSTPEWIFGRPETLTGGYHWSVYHKSMTSASYYLSLNQNIAQTSNSDVWGSAPTSSIINLGVSMSNSSQPIILYCWHSVEGYSKFGKYSGNGSTDGPFIYTGFKPAWVMVKNASGTSAWVIYDNKRNSFNPMDKYLLANSNAAEATAGSLDIDMVSNGFKIRGNDGGYNGSGITVIYIAFAEHPFVGDGTSPVTAR